MASATIGSLAVQLVAGTGGLSAGLKSASTMLSTWAGRVTSLVASPFQMALTPINALHSALGRLATGYVGLLAAGGTFQQALTPIKLASDMEDALLTFQVLFGSQSRAAELMEQMQTYASRTPFTTEGMVSGMVQLAGVLPATNDQLMHTMKLLGELASADPFGSPDESIRELAHAYAQVASRGRVGAEAMNMFATRGVPIWEALGKAVGKTVEEVRKLSETGQLPASTLDQALEILAGEGGQFQGMQERKSLTMKGRWSTLQDNIKLAATELGKFMSYGLGLADLVDSLASGTMGWKDQVKGLWQYAGDIRSVFAALRELFWGGWEVAKQVGAQLATWGQALWDSMPGLKQWVASLGEAVGQATAFDAGPVTSWGDALLVAMERVALGVLRLVDAVENFFSAVEKGLELLKADPAEWLKKQWDNTHVSVGFSLDPVGGKLGVHQLAGGVKVDAPFTPSPELAEADRLALQQMRKDAMHAWFERTRDRLAQPKPEQMPMPAEDRAGGAGAGPVKVEMVNTEQLAAATTRGSVQSYSDMARAFAQRGDPVLAVARDQLAVQRRIAAQVERPRERPPAPVAIP